MTLTATDGYVVTLGTQLLSGDDGLGAAWTCEQLDGWQGSPGSTLQVTQKTRGPGGWLSSRQLTPRTVTVGGKVYAQSTQLLRDALDRLNAAASLDGATLAVTESGAVGAMAMSAGSSAMIAGTRRCVAYRQDEVLAAALTDVVAQWSVQFTLPDPRKTADPVTASTGLAGVSGGLTFPITFPFTINSTVSLGQCSLTNPGNVAGRLTMRINGPIVGPAVTDLYGNVLAFSPDLTVASGDWLDIDHEAQSVLANGQSSRAMYLTSLGWQSFLPGLNNYTLTAASGTGNVSISGLPSWQ